MTNKEAIKYLIVPFATSTKSYNEYLKQKEAYELAIKALEEMSQDDLISRKALKKELIDSCIDETMKVPLPFVLRKIDNAPAVCGNNPKWCENCVSKGKCASTKPQGDCENCDFRKFTENFIDGVVEVMKKNDTTSLEQLSEILKGGTEE